VCAAGAYVRAQAGSFAEAVPFVVRDERRHKCVVLRAELEFGKGLVLSGAGVGAPAIMRLTFADKSEDVLGKVQHANTATLYKVCTCVCAHIAWTCVRRYTPRPLQASLKCAKRTNSAR
jgi:hypothetical protein